MSVQILATKLYIPPPRPGFVPRPRLIERLNEGRGRKLTLVSAPAGFGKTTLVGEWISHPALPVEQGSSMRAAWLSLDEDDGDPARFLAYLVAALQTIDAELGKGVLAALRSPQPPPAETLLTGLVNEIAALPEHFVLVLDDYHQVDSEAVDRALTFLLEHLPPQMHLVIAGREDPPLPLARLRARGQLAELRAADLRFTPAEAAEFLNRAMGLNLSEGDVAALEARTEGWIAGLQLAALALQAPAPGPGQEDAAGFIQSFTGSHRFVLDYLLEEVLQRQPALIQAFLLRTSILDRLCGSLCDAILRDADVSGQETLEALERANLFIVPLDGERRWYRYHHLFGDLLRERLGRPPGFAELHLRASRWHAEHGDLGTAFHHAHTAGDFLRAAELAEAAWQGMDESFQTAAWRGWVGKLPEEVIRARPVLCTQLGWAFMDAGDPGASESRLRDAERCLERSADASLPGRIAMARAYNAQVQGDLPATVKYAELALRLLPADDFLRRAQATVTLEFTHWVSGDLEAAGQSIIHWMESMQRAGNLVYVVASGFALADIRAGQGRLRDAEQAYRDALALAAAQGAEAEGITAHHHLGLAMLAHERGDDETRAQCLEKARQLGEQTTLVDWPYRRNLAQAQLKEAEGDLEAALTLLAEAKRVYVKNPVPDLRPIAALQARVHLRQGRLDKARAWAKERGLRAGDEASYLREFELLTFARVLIAGRSFSGVDELLERLLEAADEQARLGSVLEILVTQALAHEVQGSRSRALAALERALTLAEPEGYVRLFAGEGEPMRRLLTDLRASIEKQSQGRAHPLAAYMDRLLAAFAPPTAASQSAIGNRQSAMIEPLSERELEVLRLIAQGLSNGEISRRLSLALSTVKGHNLRIFGKLQAQNRTEAVARARELGLL